MLSKALRAAETAQQQQAWSPPHSSGAVAHRALLLTPNLCRGWAGTEQTLRTIDGVFVQVVRELCNCCIRTCNSDGQTKAEAHSRLPGTSRVLWHRWTIFNMQLNLERCFIFLILCDVFDDQALFFLHYNKRLHWTVLCLVHYSCYTPLNWPSPSGWGQKGAEFYTRCQRPPCAGATHGWQHHADPSSWVGEGTSTRLCPLLSWESVKGALQ